MTNPPNPEQGNSDPGSESSHPGQGDGSLQQPGEPSRPVHRPASFPSAQQFSGDAGGMRPPQGFGNQGSNPLPPGPYRTAQGPTYARQTPQSGSTAAASAYQPNPVNAAKAKRRRIIALIVAIVLIVGIGGYFLIDWLTSRNDERDSQAAMTGLLTAIQQGDADTALSYLDTAGDPSLTQDQPLLTNDALTGNPGSFVFNPDFVSSHSGGTYSQQASVQIGDDTRVVQWSFTKVDGEWKAKGSDVLGQINLAAGQSVLINDVEVPSGPATVSALPGSYTITSGLTLLSYASSQANFAVFTGGDTSINAELVVADGVQDQVAGQIRGIIAGCVAEKTAPGTCNWVLQFDNGHAQDGSITWTLSPEDPASQIELPTQGWSAEDAFTQTVSVRYQTTAEGKGVLDDGSEGTFDGYTRDRTSFFSVDLSGDEPVVTLIS